MSSGPLQRAAAITIAIDGPSGSGKSSVSRAVARRLSLRYLDTGAMFRALTLWCLRHGIDLKDHERVAHEAEHLPLQMGTDPQDPGVWLEEERVDTQIRSAAISAAVSDVATNRQVRAVLAAEQRRIIAEAREACPGIVVEGRDITTVIAPDAEHRILLSADERARMQRRRTELVARGDVVEDDSVRDQVVRRDRDDSTVSQFMTPTAGVQGIDTSDLTFAQSVAAVLRVVAPGEAAHTPELDTAPLGAPPPDAHGEPR